MNLTLRHFVGGFVGGFVGILALHFAGFWMMLVGCILGFITGFWADEIWSNLRKPYVKFEGPVGSFFLRTLPSALGTMIKFFFSVPSKFIKWFRAHPMNRSWIATLVAAATWFVLAFWTAGWLSTNHPLQHAHHMTKETQSDNGLYWFLCATAAFSGFILNIGFSNEFTLKQFYRRYTRWSQSQLWFTVTEFIRMAYSGIGLTVILVACFVGGVVGLFCVVMLMVVMLILQLMSQLLFSLSTISTRKAHWTGVAITLITTATTVLFTRNTLSGSTVWLIALGNGMLSASLSVGAHLLIKRVFRSDKLLHATFVADPFDILTASGGLAMERIVMPALRIFTRPLASPV